MAEGWGRLEEDGQKHYYINGLSACGPRFDPGYRLDQELPPDMEKDKCRKCKRELNK